MTRLVWVLQILLALAFAGAGTSKLTSSRADLIANGMGWAEGFSDTQVQLIGAAEVAGAIGLIVPAATGIAPALTPIAAAALAVLMGGAVMTHAQRGEGFIPPLVLGVLSALVAYLRFKR
jgi:uncharacterized membrane protein YphA (DoxX/SURF4 family)